jgi:hypoxanthine phosphoribosyltransferase
VLPSQEAWALLERAEMICSPEEIRAVMERLAREITADLRDAYPLVLSVMGGAVVFTGQLLPLLRFPLDFDYLHASRYGDRLAGTELSWKALPKQEVKGRVVLVLDDILDEGHTLAAIRDKMLEMGAASFRSAVFSEKELGRDKPIKADYVGVRLPNRYVFGFGMDAKGAWRNLPAVYAMKE